MSTSVRAVVLTVDDRKLIAGLINAENKTLEVAQRTVTTINRASEIALLGLQAIGVAVDTTFRIQAIAIRTAINTFIQTRAALSVATVNPLLVAETIITGGVMLYLLYAQLRAIQTGQQEVSAQMSASFQLVRMSGGVYL